MKISYMGKHEELLNKLGARNRTTYSVNLIGKIASICASGKLETVVAKKAEELDLGEHVQKGMLLGVDMSRFADSYGNPKKKAVKPGAAARAQDHLHGELYSRFDNGNKGLLGKVVTKIPFVNTTLGAYSAELKSRGKHAYHEDEW
jgi:hypothetical protein